MRSLVVLLLGVAACSGDAKKSDSVSARSVRAVEFPVEVQVVRSRAVTYLVTAVGTVDAFETVQVTARVGGAIEKIHFAEGDEVKEGAKLAEIEPRRYQIAVDSARGTRARSSAEVAEAQSALDRREEANKKSPGLVRADELEQVRAKVATARAGESEAQAALELAELNLKDAVVRAPLRGVIESRAARTGQYVQPGAMIATLVRREPMLLRFDVAEDEAEKLATGGRVVFTVRGGGREYHAKITHVGQAANPTSRMVQVTSEVDDPARNELRPGAFAEVRVDVGEPREIAVVPETAIRPTERGFLAFVVEDGVAKQRLLRIGLRTSDGAVEVREGLKSGERLVVRGGEALREGAKVREQSPPGEGEAEGRIHSDPRTERSAERGATRPGAPGEAAAPTGPPARTIQ